jgi:single-strand DNA-binding protein
VYEPTIELSGHLGSDPELRITPSGVAVCDLRVAVTPRRKVGDDWVDLETLWFTVVTWKQLAENAAQSLHKGDRVTVRGRLAQQTYTKGDGTSGVKAVIDAIAVGADLSRAVASLKRPLREGSAAEVFSDKYASTETGEIGADASALAGDVVAVTAAA